MAYAVGEDRSGYQAVVPWTPDAFGFAKATEATNYTDSAFRMNWANLRAEGKVRGAYHFFHPADPAVAQAQYFVGAVKAAGLIPGDILICDAELTSGVAGMEEYSSAHGPRRSHVAPKAGVQGAVGPLVLQFLNTVSSLAGAQHPVVLYTDLFMAESYLGNCSGYPLFVAYYASSPPGVSTWKRWTFWQHEAGGAYGGGDADYFNGTTEQLLAWRNGYLDTDWTETLVNNLPTLQLGSKDAAGEPWHVRRMQVLVAGYGRWNGLGKVTAIADDGVFGASTKAAVEAVQGHAKLTKDGVVGQDTWTLLIG